MGKMPDNLAMEHFARESNLIEGILARPTEDTVDAHTRLLGCKAMTVEAVEAFVDAVEPGAGLRRRRGMDVTVGGHQPIPGGELVEHTLIGLLDRANRGTIGRHEFYLRYEHLHPFMDCNGRSGRAVWAWMFKRGMDEVPTSFLHEFHRDALAAFDRERAAGMEVYL